ncbi:hypothetical protein D8674_021449 [Pyrus ussuriensis x Pyrus communis]|uniref:Uncharacterized protein n=1 Tax=Pyrus ussuriensis x Pyrus communis TaxID=2448454 RepID=A0A5N5GLW6_9ROSA|nr:hypothetical protein D8674_021449 [Pyrus ussuriensis x Pyrus communis]
MVVSPSSMVSMDAQAFALRSGVSACAARFDLAAWLIRLNAARLVRLGLGCSAICCCCSYGFSMRGSWHLTVQNL